MRTDLRIIGRLATCRVDGFTVIGADNTAPGGEQALNQRPRQKREVCHL